MKAIGSPNLDASTGTATVGTRKARAGLASAWSWILLGGLIVGTLDLVFAMSFWALRDVAPIRVVQSVAAWVLGRDAARAGGWTTALLGAGLHYYLMTAIVAVSHFASQHHAKLLRHPLRYGALYGAACFVLVHVIVVPLYSAAPPRTIPFDWYGACFAAHVVLVGIPCGLLARYWHTRS